MPERSRSVQAQVDETELIGECSVAGVTFAKFSVPRGRVRFTTHAAIFLLDGMPTLALRVGNLRRDLVVGVEVTVVLLYPYQSREGMNLWRTDDLLLRRGRNPALTRGWTVLHTIDAKSPLHDLRWGYRHADVLAILPGGRTRVDLRRFDVLMPCAPTDAFA